MARIVIAAGTPHDPGHPQQVLEEGPGSETGLLYAQVAQRLTAARPDLILFFDSDHFVNFFFNNLPTFCVGIVEEAEGPAEDRVQMPRYRVPMHQEMARQLFAYALERGFDAASAEELVLDHSILVPLHFLTPRMDIPIVPIFIRGLAAPLPRAARCLELGRMVRDFIEVWPGEERVALLASGSFSLEVGGPRMGRTDRAWMEVVMGHLRESSFEALAALATTERMQTAGNVSGELLNWLALGGAIGNIKPGFIEPQHGHAFAVWDLERP